MPPSLGLVVLSHVTVGVRGLGVPLSLPLSAPGMRARSLSLSLSRSLCAWVHAHVSVHSCESKNLVELQAGTNKTDVVCGESWRMGPGSRQGIKAGD